MKTNKYTMIKTGALLLIAGIMASSCENEFILDLENFENVIVVNSMFSGDKELSVTVTKSMHPQKEQDVIELKDATVSLFRDGNFVEEMIYSKLPEDSVGRFYSGTTPVTGSTYKIEVADKMLHSVATNSVLPQKVEMFSDTAQWVKWVTVEDSASSIRFYFEISFNDPSEKNYYYITASAPIYEVNLADNTRKFNSWQYAEIITGVLPNHELYVNNALLFKDDTFNGSLKKITGTATMESQPSSFAFDGNKYYVVDKKKLHVELHSLSNDAYNFCSSYAKKIAAQDDVYSEPVTIYSNVENGLGIFAGENVSTKDILIKY